MWLDIPQKPPIPSRVRALMAIAIAMLLIVIGRLWYLQIALGSRLEQEAKGNTARWDRLAAPRGILTDRHGKPIATVALQEVVFLSPADARKYPQTVTRVAAILGSAESEILDLLAASQLGRYKPAPIAVGVTQHQLTALLEELPSLPGVEIVRQPIRSYIEGKLWAHSVGYVGPINEKELAASEEGVYAPNDYIGKVGVEATHEARLRGTAGGEKYEVDSRGRKTRLLSMEDPKPGARLALTFDTRLQRAALDGLREKGYRGAVVALAPRTGEVLAMVSSPTYDPELFVRKLSTRTWKSLNSADKPMYNRAIRTALAPGSTFKIISAIAGLSSGTISPASSAHCPGYIRLGRWRFRCHSVHGSIGFHRALTQSCDVFFYHHGLAMGPERLAATARACGLGQKTGIDLPHESRGTLPDPAWKKRVYKEPWRGGDTVNFSIGQGFLATTPLQMACVTALVANRGVLYRPQTVQRMFEEGQTTFHFKPEETHRIAMDAADWDSLITAMVDTTESGTAQRAKIPGIRIASKTGSAEEKRGQKTHAWFIAFAPADAPEIAICVFVEAAGHGGDVAAPIAKKVLEAYFGKPVRQ